MGIPDKTQDKYTYRDYLLWEDPWELIHGVPYAMSPAPARSHQKISQALERIIDDYLTDHPCEMYHAPFDVRLPEAGESEETTTTVVQPDILVVWDREKLDERGCKGAPDFIIEILSPSTAAKDMFEKLFLYEAHGVKEYWIVDPWDKTVKAYRQIAEKKFRSPKLFSCGEILEPEVLPGLQIEVNRIFPAEI